MNANAAKRQERTENGTEMTSAAYAPGDKVRVKPEHDIPPMFRNGPSRGMVDHILGGTLIVVVDGKSVPYQPEEVESDA